MDSLRNSRGVSTSSDIVLPDHQDCSYQSHTTTTLPPSTHQTDRAGRADKADGGRKQEEGEEKDKEEEEEEEKGTHDPIVIADTEDVSGGGGASSSLIEHHHRAATDNDNHHDHDHGGDGDDEADDDDNDIHVQNYNRYLLDRWRGGGIGGGSDESSSGQASPSSAYASVTSPPMTPPFRTSVRSVGDRGSRNYNDDNYYHYHRQYQYHPQQHQQQYQQQQQQQQSGRTVSPSTSHASAVLWQPPVRTASREMLWQPPVRSTSAGRPGSLRSSISYRPHQQHQQQQQAYHQQPPQTQTLQPQQPELQQQPPPLPQQQQEQEQQPQPDEYPQYPNQSYAVLQEQEHPVYHVPPWLRGQTPVQAGPTESARVLATAGSASSKPAPGLFVDQPVRLNIIDDDRRPPSSSVYPSFVAEPKETHTVAVDIDEQTGNKLINEYEIIGELGRGEHGKVKLGVHGRTGRKVAIKVVQRYSKRRRLGKLGNPEDKVKKEVAILKKARHPNVVSLLEVIDDSNQQKAYIVLEYVENGEIIWRRKGLKEIVIVDKKRLDREKRGVPDTQSFIAESQQFVESARLQREKLRKERRARRREGGARRPANHYGWSLEHGGDTDDELSDDLSSLSSGSFTNGTSPSEWRVAMQNNRYWPDFMQLGKQSPSSFTSADLEDEIDDLSYVPCLTIRQVRSAFQDAVLGLEYLHYQGIIHRDIKPANLLVSKHKRIKISDFGVSYLGKPIRDDDDGSPAVTSSSSTSKLDDARELSKTVGTPAFYAPELCYTGPESDAEPYVPPKITGAIDIWSLGVTLYAMVFGRLPFIYDDHSLFHNIVHTPVFIPTKRLVPVEPKPAPPHSAASSTISNNSKDKDYDKNGSKPKPPRAKGIRADDELVYEKIDEDLRDLIKRLLTKDPTKRITLKEIKQHPWLLRDIERPERWLADTDPARHGGGRKIEVSNEEVTQAVTRIPFMQRVKSNVARLGSTIFGRSLSGTKLAKDKSPAIDSRNNSSSQISQATPVSGSVSDLSRCSSGFTLPGRFGSKKVRSTVDLAGSGAAQSKTGGEPHPLSGYVSASTVDNGQEGVTGGASKNGNGDGDGDDKNAGKPGNHDDDDDEDDGAVFFGGGNWADDETQPLQRSPSLKKDGKPVPRYDSSWRLSVGGDSAQGSHTEMARIYDRSSSIRHPYRAPSQQISVRYGEPSAFSTAQRNSMSSNDGMRSPSIWGERPQRPSYDAESVRARLEETIVNPGDSREASLLKQRQFQREYFHPSLANSKVDVKAGRPLSGSYSSRDSDWSPDHDINMEARTIYTARGGEDPTISRSRSPTYPRPVSSSSNSHRTGTSRTSIVLPDPSITSHTSSIDATGRRPPRVHVPVPDRDEPPIYARFVPAAARKPGFMPPVQPEAAGGSESSSSAEEESDDEDGLLYLGRVPRPSKIQLKK